MGKKYKKKKKSIYKKIKKRKKMKKNYNFFTAENWEILIFFEKMKFFSCKPIRFFSMVKM